MIARDQSVVATKGHAPHFSERERARLVRELSCVDAVLLGGLRDHLSVIKRVRPDVIALGYDHAVDEDALRKDLRRLSVTPIPKIVRIRSHRPDRYASRFVCNSSSVKKEIGRSFRHPWRWLAVGGGVGAVIGLCTFLFFQKHLPSIGSTFRLPDHLILPRCGRCSLLSWRSAERSSFHKRIFSRLTRHLPSENCATIFPSSLSRSPNTSRTESSSRSQALPSEPYGYRGERL